MQGDDDQENLLPEVGKTIMTRYKNSKLRTILGSRTKTTQKSTIEAKDASENY